jgi:NhaP-type Na+/H+ or K+/H+ antiporter
MTASDLPPNRQRNSLLIPISIWAVFLAGLMLQLFSPHLQIDHNSFVIPQDLINQGVPIDPRALVRQERVIQICSALLALAGAIGLALYYRRALSRSWSGRGE